MAKTVTHQDLKSYFGDKNHLEEAQRKSFSDLIFELLSEREPTKEESKVFELVLNLSIDHGPDTPSAIKTIQAARAGKTISQSLSAGVLEINDTHGGAIEPAMKMVNRIKNQELRINEMVAKYLEENKKIPGYGHRIYKDSDPRAQLILKKLKETNLDEEFINIALEIEKELEKQIGKKLVLNIDGAIAVALCSFSWNPKLGKAVFLIARTPGLIAHYLNNS